MLRHVSFLWGNTLGRRWGSGGFRGRVGKGERLVEAYFDVFAIACAEDFGEVFDDVSADV